MGKPESLNDTQWIYDYYKAADSLDMPRLCTLMADDVRLQIANRPVTIGIAGFQGAIGILRRRDGKVHDLRIFADNTQL